MKAIEYAISLMPNKKPSELAHKMGYTLQRINGWRQNDIPQKEFYKVCMALRPYRVEARQLAAMKFEARKK